MESPNGAAAAVSAITAKAKLAGLWREKVDQHSTGTISTVWVGWEGERMSTGVTPMSERKIIQIGSSRCSTSGSSAGPYSSAIGAQARQSRH
jgi:hypothetical protein